MRELTDVLVADGPFVTVLVESESDVEQAASKYDLVWRDVRRTLTDKGVDERTLEAVLAARGHHSEGQARLVVASTDDHQVRLATSLRHRPRQQVVDVAPLPHLLPLVDELTQRVPYVLVTCDRAGATVEGWWQADEPAREVTGDASTGWGTDPRGVEKWQHTNHQHLYERGWTHDMANDIVRTISEIADQVHPEVVIGVGDQRELSAVADHLPADLTPRWRVVEGGRGGDGSEDLVRQRVNDLLHVHVVTKTLDQLEDYAQERGQGKRGCDGVEEVVAALRKAQVATLLLTTAAPQDQVLHFGPEPAQLAMTAQELADLGVPLPSSGPLVDVLIRAALGTGAEVQLVPHELEQAPQGGVGALLRYADSPASGANA